MVEVDYSRIHRPKKQAVGEFVVRNAFYRRDERRKEPSRINLYNGYHTNDYFKPMVLLNVLDSSEG